MKKSSSFVETIHRENVCTVVGPMLGGEIYFAIGHRLRFISSYE